MDIFLIRHAQANPPDFSQKDIDRTLTPQGETDAMRLGNLMMTKDISPDLFLCSTAVRTKRTTDLICEQIKFDPEEVQCMEELYEASTRIMLQIINELDDKYKRVFLVAHNPAINYLSEYVTGSVIGNVSPAGVVHLSLNCDSWSEVSKSNVDLVSYLDPIKL